MPMQRCSPGLEPAGRENACTCMQNNVQTIPRLNTRRSGAPYAALATMAGAAALAVAALYNRASAREAERSHPPTGRFIEVGGVRLHYIEAGAGAPLVLLHGNGSTVDELVASGLVDLAAKSFRVIAFDRPGFGHSERPGGRVWSAARQAALIAKAMQRLDASPALVFGHSWGTLVALNLALDHPRSVSALALASGYYFPSARADAFFLSPPAAPIVGDLIANTIAPLATRLMWERMVKRMFAPAPVPAKFRAYPRELAVRPGQLQAAAQESALMIGEAAALEPRYRDVRQPIVLIAGQGDRMVDAQAQSARLHGVLPSSSFERLRGVGHMVHETATARVMSAIQRAAFAARPAPAVNPDQPARPAAEVG